MERSLDFREVSCVILGAITGALIGVPWLQLFNPSISAAIGMVFAVLGGMVGYRQRKSTLFFYVCLISVIGLASLISSAWISQ